GAWSGFVPAVLRARAGRRRVLGRYGGGTGGVLLLRGPSVVPGRPGGADRHVLDRRERGALPAGHTGHRTGGRTAAGAAAPLLLDRGPGPGRAAAVEPARTRHPEGAGGAGGTALVVHPGRSAHRIPSAGVPHRSGRPGTAHPGMCGDVHRGGGLLATGSRGRVRTARARLGGIWTVTVLDRRDPARARCDLQGRIGHRGTWRDPGAGRVGAPALPRSRLRRSRDGGGVPVRPCARRTGGIAVRQLL